MTIITHKEGKNGDEEEEECGSAGHAEGGRPADSLGNRELVGGDRA